jgi:hypothetical protein
MPGGGRLKKPSKLGCRRKRRIKRRRRRRRRRKKEEDEEEEGKIYGGYSL